MFNPPGFAASGGKTISTWPRVLVQIAWNAGGNTTAPSHWYTVSDRLRGNWKADLSGRQYEMDEVESGKFTFTLDNLDGVFDPDNASSPFYPNVVPYRRCRLVFMTNPTQNLLYPWVAGGTSTVSMSTSVGTLGTATGLPASPSGLTTAQTWAVPNGAGSGSAFGLHGDAGASWSTNDCDGTTATPGLTYSAGVDVSLAAGGMSSLPLKARIAFYDLSGNLISRTLGAVQSVTTSWTRLTVSATAPSNAVFVLTTLSTNAATTAATTVQTTGWQLEQATAPTAYAAPGGWYQMWQGFVERWPQRYDRGGKYGLVDITAVDALAPLSQLVIANAMATYMSQQNASYMFDLATPGTPPDIASGKAFLDQSNTGSGLALDLVGPNIYTGSSISSGSQLGTLWNVPGPVITLSNPQSSSLGNASGAGYLQWADKYGKTVALPGTGWTRMICFRTGVTPGTGGSYSVATLWAATAPGFTSGTGDQSGVYLYINSSGNVGCNIQNSAGTSLARVNSYVNVCDDDWHCAILSLSSDGLTLHLTVDGTYFFGTAASSVGSSTKDMDTIGSLVTSAGTNTQPFDGDMAWVAQWNTELPVSTQLDITKGFATGWAGDTSGNRLGRIMSLSNFSPGTSPGAQYIGSFAKLGGVTLTGRSPLDVMQESADTEVGQFTVDRNGTPTLFGQLWRWKQSQPRVTFGEASGEVPYKGDITFEQDPAHLYNDIQITCDGSADLTNSNALQEAQDSTSQANYFPQTLQKTTNPQYVQGGMNVASYLLSQYKDPHTRLSGLSVDCASNPSALTALVGLNFADMVKVNRRPTGAPMKSLLCFIEQVSWSGDDTGKNLVASFQMSPASQYEYGMVSSTWGQLTAGVSAGATTITVGKLNNTNVIAAQYVIPGGVGYQMTLGYGTANAETVTIQSVQAVSAGYTSVQITLTSATTKSHSLNDYLCDPLPSNVGLPPVGTYPSCFDIPSLTGGNQPLIGF